VTRLRLLATITVSKMPANEIAIRIGQPTVAIVVEHFSYAFASHEFLTMPPVRFMGSGLNPDHPISPTPAMSSSMPAR
jgi:hypothetical protein